MNSERQFLETYETIKALYEAVFHRTDAGIEHESNNCIEEAIADYEESIKLIEKIFTIPVGVPQNFENVKLEWFETCRCIQKLKELRYELEKRLQNLNINEKVFVNAPKETEIRNDNTEEEAPQFTAENTAEGKNETSSTEKIQGVVEESRSLDEPHDMLVDDTCEEVLPHSQQVSKQIISAADYISNNLIKGAEKTGELVTKTTPYIISKIEPSSEHTPVVSPKLQATVECAKVVTNVAAGATGWVANKIGSVALATGRYLGPHIQAQYANILEKGLGYNSMEANSHAESAFTLAAGAVEGISTIYDGVEASTKILGSTISENSVKIIEQKYGKDAGKVAATTFESVGNAIIVGRNINYMKPKGIAKGVAKGTGKALVNEYQRVLRMDTIPAGDLTPNLNISRTE